MKKELKKEAQKEAQTVTNANVTETQVINPSATEATENGTDTPTPETELKPENSAPTPTVETETAKKQTFEELQKLLDTELARLNYKKRLAQQRETFINSMGSLQLYIETLASENEFETQSGKITFKVLGTDRYDHPNFIETFTISNTDIISKFCNILLSEMKEKKTELETQLLTA